MLAIHPFGDQRGLYLLETKAQKRNPLHMVKGWHPKGDGVVVTKNTPQRCGVFPPLVVGSGKLYAQILVYTIVVDGIGCISFFDFQFSLCADTHYFVCC